MASFGFSTTFSTVYRIWGEIMHDFFKHMVSEHRIKNAALFFLLTILILLPLSQAYAQKREEVEIEQTSQGGVCFTFDDQDIEGWSLLGEVLQAYDAKATFFVSGFLTLKAQQVKALRLLQSQGSEIGSHSLSHVKPLEYGKTHSGQEYYDEEVFPSVFWMRLAGLKVSSFAYPGGIGTQDQMDVLMEHFPVIRMTEFTRETNRIPNTETIYYKPGQPVRIVQGVGIDRRYENAPEEVKAGLDRAKERGEIVTFYAHKIHDEDPYGIDLETMTSYIDYAHQIGLKFYTVSDLGR